MKRTSESFALGFLTLSLMANAQAATPTVTAEQVNQKINDYGLSSQVPVGHGDGITESHHSPDRTVKSVSASKNHICRPEEYSLTNNARQFVMTPIG
ncbi:MAG: hypothetical protein AAF417_23545, partial [Pseudomonadota bacterium]